MYETEDQFVESVNAFLRQPGYEKDNAVVYIHGFNTTFEWAAFRAAQIAYDLGNEGKPFGTMFFYSWPSGGRAADYVHDRESVVIASAYLKAFLELIVEKTKAKYVHLIGHSLGNWPLLKALEDIKLSKAANDKLQQLILAAPDVDEGEFKTMASKILSRVRTVTLYASSNDRALNLSRSLHRGLPRAGEVMPDRGPVIVTGIDSIDVSNVSTDVLSAGHTDYADKRELLNDIALLLLEGRRPPNKRTPMLATITSSSGQFWRYPK